MNINKAIAEEVAEKLLAKPKEKRQIKKNELSLHCVNLYNSKIEREVINLLLQLPRKWQNERTDIYFSSNNGSKTFYWHLTDNYIVLGSKDRYCVISPDEMNELEKMQSEINKINSQINQYKKQIVDQLLKLRTFKRIEVDFPRAFQYLPTQIDGQNLPSICINDLLKGIDSI